MVLAALTNHAWARDIGPDLTAGALEEFLRLWQRVSTPQLTEDTEGALYWAWDGDGRVSARSAYAARFWGLQVAPEAQFTWGSRAPLRCRFFSWLALKNRCWTSDRLARRGLPHQAACPLCDQEEETIHHLLLGCVFARHI